MNKSRDVRIVHSEASLVLSQLPVCTKLLYQSEEEYFEKLDHYRNLIAEHQARLHADHSRAVLVLFQGMDAAGKDGAIKHVLSGISARGIQVTAFKRPTETEYAQDFLRRISQSLPRRGQIGVFNRSHYEDVLVTRVHPEILKSSRLDRSPDAKFWTERFQDIVNFERYLEHQGFEIIKIFLHISKAEQKTRLLSRIDTPRKSWKIESSDIAERKHWSRYQNVYSECFRRTGTKTSPWYVVPADDKKNARILVAQLVANRLAAMKLKYPAVDPDEKKRLKRLKASLLRQ